MTRGDKIDPGSLDKRSDHVIVELLDRDHYEHRPNRLGRVAVEQGDECGQRAPDDGAEERDQIEEPGDDPDQEPEGEIDQPHAEARGETDDECHQQLATNERTECRPHLARDESELLPVLGRSHLERACFEPLQVDEDVRRQNWREAEYRDSLGYSPDHQTSSGAETEQQILHRLLIGRVVEPCLDGLLAEQFVDIEPEAGSDIPDPVDAGQIEIGKSLAELGRLLSDRRERPGLRLR